MAVTKSTKRLIGRGLVIGAFALIVYVFLFGDYGAYRIWKQKKEIGRLEQTIRTLRGEQERLRREVDLLQTDPAYIEKIAREEYGMIKEGEILYKIVAPPREKEGTGEEGNDEPPAEQKGQGLP